jgi:hypothetical protein
MWPLDEFRPFLMILSSVWVEKKTEFYFDNMETNTGALVHES